MLSEIAIADPEAFDRIVEMVKPKIEEMNAKK
jgi:ribosomal protein L20